MDSKPLAYLFFYGSLKKDFPIQDQLGISASLSFVEYGQLAGTLYDLGDYPALVAGTDKVQGEIFAIWDEAVLRQLDEYEGYDPLSPETSLYVRELASCGERLVWVYIYQGDLRFAERLVAGFWPSTRP